MQTATKDNRHSIFSVVILLMGLNSVGSSSVEPGRMPPPHPYECLHW
jgi:hypothetical protein